MVKLANLWQSKLNGDPLGKEERHQQAPGPVKSRRRGGSCYKRGVLTMVMAVVKRRTDGGCWGGFIISSIARPRESLRGVPSKMVGGGPWPGHTPTTGIQFTNFTEIYSQRSKRTTCSCAVSVRTVAKIAPGTTPQQSIHTPCKPKEAM